jgi:hypothetical protein
MRALLCHCREHLEAPNDRVLVEVVSKHLMLEHPTLVPSQEQAREIVRTRAYDFELYVPEYAEETGLEPYRAWPR